MVHLHCCGDILPADRLNTLGIGVGSKLKNSEIAFIKCLNAFNNENSVIRFGNLESPLISSDAFNLSGLSPFAGHPEFSFVLKSAGFDILSVANNHIDEYSTKGFNHTIAALKNAGIEPVGVANHHSSSNTIIIEKSDIKIGFAAFSSIQILQAKKNYAELNQDNINAAIKDLKKQAADIIVLSFHWGDEYTHIPSIEQIQIARNAVDLGAQVILGHHSHAVQPVEEYNNGLIFYSLGNFLFDMLWSKKVRTGLYPVIKLSRNGIEDFQLYQVSIQEDYYPEISKMGPWLCDLLNNSEEKMKKLFNKGEKIYNKKYSRLVQKNRFFARIGMKIQLYNQWSELPENSKKIIKDHIAKKTYN